MAITFSSPRWLRAMTFLVLSCLCYLYTARLQERGALQRLPQLPSITIALNPKSALLPFVLEPLPLGSIKPLGWLKDQLQLMSHGLAGHQYDFYEFVHQSSWLGGDQEYSALNEAFPYWFNGLVPLAYGLDDERLKQQVHEAAQHVIDHQLADGWLGPETAMADRLLWARFPLCLGMMQLAQANDTWTRPVLASLHRFNTLLYHMLRDDGNGYTGQPAGNWSSHMMSWGRVRGSDMILVLQWLLEHYPAGAGGKLLANMRLLHALGLRWEDWYNEAAYFQQGIHNDLLGVDNDVTEANFHYTHGVNVAQGLKSAAVIRRFTHNESLVQTALDGVKWTMTFHGAPSGTILADERLVGLAAFSGSELCTSVELMYSLAYLYQALGDSSYADQAELAAFNSLPVMLTADWWAHQYVTAPNQPYAAYLPEQPFYNTNNWAQTYGLEPHYPCCTVNHPQGWPKFVSNSWARRGHDGLAHILLGPGSVHTTVAGGQVVIQATTAYPFADQILYTIDNEHAFDMSIRIPHWAGEQSFIVVGDLLPAPLDPDSHSRLHRVRVHPGTRTNISVHLQSSIRIQPRGPVGDDFAVYKGALLYALEIAATNSSTRPRQFRQPNNQFHDSAEYPAQAQDYELYSASKWNVAVDPSSLVWHESSGLALSSDQISNPVFAADANVGYMTARACEIHWPMRAQSVPDLPPPADKRDCIGAVHEVKLIPYGCAKLHMSELPAIHLPATPDFSEQAVE